MPQHEQTAGQGKGTVRVGRDGHDTSFSITGARLVDPWNGLDQESDLHVSDKKIIGIGAAPHGFRPVRTIDGRGKILSPGLVDLSARLREPGYQYKASLESEMKAAVAGGVTSLACPPDTDPPLDEPGLVEMLKYRAHNMGLAHLYPLGALTVGLRGEALTEMLELTDAGCVGFAQAHHPIRDTQVLLRALQYAHSYGYTVWLNPSDPWLGGGVMHAGPFASRLGLPGNPVMAETIALHTIIELVASVGCRVHLCRLSSAAGVELVRQARKRGLPLTADVSIDHLHLTDLDVGFFDTAYRLDPPLRAQRDRDALRAGLLDGTIDAICSDHTPVLADAKRLPFGEAEPGAVGLSLLLPLALKWGRESGQSLLQVLDRLTRIPAGIAGLERAPHANPSGLWVGGRADLCLFDPDALWKVTPDTLWGQCANTPWLGHEVQGRVHLTAVGGRIVFER